MRSRQGGILSGDIMSPFKYVQATILAFALIHSASASENFSFRTEKIYFQGSFPKGYCALDLSDDRDAFLAQYLQNLAGKSLRLVAASVPCVELSSYRQGTEHLSAHTLSLFQVGVDGSFTRFLLGKRIFSGLIQSFSFEKSKKKIEKRSARKLQRFGDELSDLNAEKVTESDTGISLVRGSADLKEKGKDSVTYCVTAAATLIHKYPFAAVKTVRLEGESCDRADDRDPLLLLKAVTKR